MEFRKGVPIMVGRYWRQFVVATQAILITWLLARGGIASGRWCCHCHRLGSGVISTDQYRGCALVGWWRTMKLLWACCRHEGGVLATSVLAASAGAAWYEVALVGQA